MHWNSLNDNILVVSDHYSGINFTCLIEKKACMYKKERVNLSKIIIGVPNEFIISSKRKISSSFSDIVMFLDELFTLGAGCGWLGDITSCRPWRPVRPTTRKSHREHAAKGHESFPVVKWMIPLRHRHTESLTGTTYLWKTKSRLPVPPHRFPNVAWHRGLKKSHVNLVDVSLWAR